MNLDHAEITALTKAFETPFYLYDGDFIERHYRQLRIRTNPAIQFYLSLKANNNIHIAKLFRQWGVGVEVASAGELALARHAGFSADNIIFSGPGKKRSELQAAVESGIYCIIAESVQELLYIEELAEQANKTVRVAVRINPDKSFGSTAIKMGGVPRQFGIDESMLDTVFDAIGSLRFTRFIGIHVYTGTQNLNTDSIIESMKYTVDLGRSIHERYGIVCEFINLGGGFGVPYFAHEKALDIDKITDSVSDYVQEARNTLFPQTTFIIESGRYLLAQAAVYVTEVLYRKTSKGENFVIVDGGMHHHAASTFRGRSMRSNYPMECIPVSEDPGRRELEKVTIAGPLCTPEDCVGKDVELPALYPGDLVCVLNSGAYGLSFSPVHFLGHPTPIEILKRNGLYELIRRKGIPEDLVATQLQTEPDLLFADK
ncbi:type III PLP-dependent enzyme [Paenibacillus sp. GbtcB18]|uniref:type III PLP-dependent enzyme n=1 Tax=Paenibacillus sp. GbtcB18 TaxID=2824763 RepID=UPI001C2F84A0|nr:type III PLP-dependent enzyme [Paenibacillus sp. GbtcB18]